MPTLNKKVRKTNKELAKLSEHEEKEREREEESEKRERERGRE